MSDNQAQEVLDTSAAEEVGKIAVDAGQKEEVSGEQSWHSRLNPDYKAHPSIQKFKSENDLAKSYLELSKTLGQPKVVIPTEKSTPEEWRAYFKAGGAPEKDDEYDVGMEDLPEEARTPTESLAALRKAAFDNGVSKKAFDAMFKTYKETANNQINQHVEGIKKMRELSETELRKEWGASYDGKVEGAQKVINTFFKDAGVRKEFSVLANDKGFIKAMANIADKLGEDVIAGRPRVTMTPQEAQSEINRIMGDKKSPLFDELHPEHAGYLEKMDGLYRMAEGA